MRQGEIYLLKGQPGAGTTTMASQFLVEAFSIVMPAYARPVSVQPAA